MSGDNQTTSSEVADRSATDDETSGGIPINRRRAMALAGVAGLGTVFGSEPAVSQSSCAESLNGDLCMNENNIQDIDNIWAGHNYSSWATSGTESGNVQLYDADAGTHFMRASEDPNTSGPGPVEFQSAVSGPDASSPGVDESGPFRVDDAAAVENLSIEGANRVDVVAEPEIDHTGDLASEIDSYLDNQSTVNHLFVLPDGTYTWDSQLDQSSFEFLGVVGAPRATLEITSHAPDYAFYLGTSGAGGRALLKNLTVDITYSSTTDAGVVFAQIERRARIENIRLEGERYWEQSNNGGKFTVRLDMVDPDGYGLVRNVYLPDGEVDPETFGSVIPFGADPPHQGTNRWQDCIGKGWTSCFYVMNNPGKNIVDGCLAQDCGNFGVRLGSNDVCRDTRIIVDGASERDSRLGTALNISGGSPLVENVKIEAPDAWNSLIRIMQEAEGATIRDVDIEIGQDSPVAAIDVNSGAPLNDRLLFENLTIVDENDGSAHPVHGPGYNYLIEDLRSDSEVVFRDCVIETNRSALAIRGEDPLDDVHIENCHIDAADYALWFPESGSGHNVVNNRFDGDVQWDETLSEVLWMGNRHNGAVNDDGSAQNWNAQANWNFNANV